MKDQMKATITTAALLLLASCVSQQTGYEDDGYPFLRTLALIVAFSIGLFLLATPHQPKNEEKL